MIFQAMNAAVTRRTAAAIEGVLHGMREHHARVSQHFRRERRRLTTQNAGGAETTESVTEPRTGSAK